MKKRYTFVRFLVIVWQFIKPYKGLFYAATFLRMTSDVAQLYGAWALSQIITSFSQSQPGSVNEFISQFWIILGLWFVLDQYHAIARGSAKIIGYQVAELSGIRALKKTLKHIFYLDLHWQEKKHSGDKLKRANRGRDAVNMFIRDYFNMMIEIVVVVVVNIGVFASLDRTIGLFLSMFMISFYALSLYMTKRASHQEYLVNKAEEKLESINYESLNNIRTIKSLSLAEPISNQITRAARVVIARIKRRIFLYQGRSLLLNIYFFAFQFGIICYLLWQIIQGNTEVGVIVLFMSYFNKLGGAIWELADVTQRSIIYKIWIERMMNILDAKPTIEVRHAQQLSYPNDWKELKLDQLKFTYAGKKALRNITTTIKRGESIGIVGLSGAGKSTLFKLLMDLYESYTGSLAIGGTELKDMDRQSYINHVAVVLQDTELFNVSLKDNIFLAKRPDQEEDEEKLNRVLEMAHLTELVERLEEGVDTIVGEKGIKLSGGERQRLGIARALYREPDILLLDEATSHLDIYSEKSIQKTLKSLLKQVTAIVIAHRLPTVKELDRILVLDKGVIAESGSFDQLMKKNGIFANMWKEQKL